VRKRGHYVTNMYCNCSCSFSSTWIAASITLRRQGPYNVSVVRRRGTLLQLYGLTNSNWDYSLKVCVRYLLRYSRREIRHSEDLYSCGLLKLAGMAGVSSPCSVTPSDKISSPIVPIQENINTAEKAGNTSILQHASPKCSSGRKQQIRSE
jgi:hypothetical protein